ncbi:MAG: hypothetical protein IJV35_07545 [Neisseriaceae bacterium]|nr:hypothetical protein [Neisseriaceae bacterium]
MFQIEFCKGFRLPEINDYYLNYFKILKTVLLRAVAEQRRGKEVKKIADFSPTPKGVVVALHT